jgi:Ca-activated chloride channel family protein
MTMSALAATPALPSTGCRLVAADGRDLPLRAAHVHVDAAGGLANVQLRQTFVNPYTEPLAVTFQLPLPASGAVVGYAFTLGGQRITGRVERREDARRAFEDAVLAGRTAALLEQERSSLFTQELGNLPPGVELQVELEVEQPLDWVSGGWEWRWPTVVGPRFLGAPGQTPDAARLVVDVDPSAAVPSTATVRIGDATTGPATSPSHPLRHEGSGVALSGALDRDVVVRWPVAALAPGVGLETARPLGDHDAYGLLTLVPPASPMHIVQRDLCLLLDTSGSMGGRPLAQLQAFATALVAGLRDGDRLELIEFSSAPRRWRPGVVVVDARVRAEATQWLRALRASGGTAMHTAVLEALAPLSVESQRQVVLMTDGWIGFEREVIGQIRTALPTGARVHVVGVGSSVNRTLTSGVARAGGGYEAIVGLDEATEPGVAALLARTGDPLWVDVRVSGSALREVAPATITDLLAGHPSRVGVRLDPAGGLLIVEARTAGGTVTRRIPVLPVAEGAGRRVVVTRFAREAVEDLEVAAAGGADARVVDSAIEALGLRHQLATRRTSWVAETTEVTVDPGAPLRRVRQPQALPYGTSAEGVGLAGASPMAKPAPAPMAAPSGAPSLRRARTESPAAPKKAEAARESESRSKRPILAADEFKLSSEAAPEPPAPVAASLAPKDQELDALVERLVAAATARVVRNERGQLILELTWPSGGDWSPSGVDLLAADGHRVTTTGPQPGTTRAGAVSAGATVRLVLAWTGPAPTRVWVSGLELVVEA